MGKRKESYRAYFRKIKDIRESKDPWERERKAGAHFSKRKVAKRKLYVSFF